LFTAIRRREGSASHAADGTNDLITCRWFSRIPRIDLQQGREKVKNLIRHEKVDGKTGKACALGV